MKSRVTKALRSVASIGVTAAASLSRSLQSPGDAALGFLFTHRYQRFYLENLYEVAAHVAHARRIRVMARSDYAFQVSLWQKMRGYDYLIHTRPFQTNAFYNRNTQHVLMSHGIDTGIYDDLGTLSFGHGRVLDAQRNRLYSHLLVGFEWAREAAECEVPEYRDRVLVIGDRRRDRVVQLENQRPRVRNEFALEAHERCVVIATTHSGRCLIANHFHDLVTLLETEIPGIRYQVVVHPYAASKYPDQYTHLTRLCERHGPRVQIADQRRLDELLVAADLMISDHGSLSMYYALLRRPLAYVSLDDRLRPDFPLMSILKSSFRLRHLREAFDLIHALAEGRLQSQMNPGVLDRLDRFGGPFEEQARKVLESLVLDLGRQ